MYLIIKDDDEEKRKPAFEKANVQLCNLLQNVFFIPLK
jgi:hypothetical protein